MSESRILSAIEIAPKRQPQRGTVIWLHGLGASGDDFEPIVPHLGLDDVAFVFPHAPAIPVTVNGGMVMPAWYDIVSLSPTQGMIREDLESVRAGARLVEALIDREIQERGVHPRSIVLAGFSQGGAMAMHVGLRYKRALLGIVALSSYLLLADQLEAEASDANRTTPMFVAHGKEDMVVPFWAGAHSRDRLRAAAPERALSWHEYTMGHEVNYQEIQDIGAWLQALAWKTPARP